MGPLRSSSSAVANLRRRRRQEERGRVSLLREHRRRRDRGGERRRGGKIVWASRERDRGRRMRAETCHRRGACVSHSDLSNTSSRPEERRYRQNHRLHLVRSCCSPLLATCWWDEPLKRRSDGIALVTIADQLNMNFVQIQSTYTHCPFYK